MTSPADAHPVSHYGDGRPMPLPAGWEPVEPSMFDTALTQTEHAFTGGDPAVDHAVQHLLAYYDPTGGYAGATFLAVSQEDHHAITAADLWAVSTLQMEIPPNAGRMLMDPTPLRTRIYNSLHRLPVSAYLSDITPAHLDDMFSLYNDIRLMLPPLGKRATNQWVLASKLCARKRPMLYPVRDSRVCGYLSGNQRLGSKAGRLGAFRRDIQVFAHLITHPHVTQRISELRGRLHEQQPTWVFDWSDLRLLDAVLWMEAARRA